MNLGDWMRKIYKKITLIKKLAWFAVNFLSLTAPFRYLKSMISKIYKRTIQLEKKINNFAFYTIPINFILEVQGQVCVIFLLIAVLAIYLFFKFFKDGNDSNKSIKKHQKSRISRQLDELSEKTIVPQTRMIRQQKQEVDSCYQELHKGLNRKQTNQDRVFLAILERYQSMGFQNEEQADDDRQMSNNHNKFTQDNSTQEGNFKNSLTRIPTSPTNKKEVDLNRSSVL